MEFKELFIIELLLKNLNNFDFIIIFNLKVLKGKKYFSKNIYLDSIIIDKN